MENLSISESNLKEKLSKRQGEQWSAMVVKSLVRCALHFQVSLTDADYEIYINGLSDIEDASKVVAAIDWCLKNCEFMPRLANIRSAVRSEPIEPLTNTPTEGVPHCAIVRDWVEPMTSTANIHYFEFSDGTRRVRVEKL